MKKLVLLLTLGGAVGYVLGARAGRPAYDKILDTYHRTADAVGLDQASQSVRSASADLRDAVAERAGATVREAGDTAVSGLHDAADQVREDPGVHRMPS
ncbi:MAG: hypothetical protein GC157_13715 [Frankiales bacterium]|nr:hypothetical protein [Frankiales bacterium]